MHIKFFVKRDCPRCPAAKHALADFAGVEVYDLDDVDGLAEAAFFNVLSTPTVLVVDSDGVEIAAWRGVAPEPGRLRQLVAG